MLDERRAFCHLHHNLLISDTGPKAIDFEITAPIEIEHTLDPFAWMVDDIQDDRLKTHERTVFANGAYAVPSPSFALTDDAAQVRPFDYLWLRTVTRQRSSPETHACQASPPTGARADAAP